MPNTSLTAPHRATVIALAICLMAALLVSADPIGGVAVGNAAESVQVLADFEGGEPAGYFSYGGGGGGVGYGVDTIGDTDPLARPGQVGDNDILSVGFNVPPGGFGGFGDDFGATSQDWTAFEGFRFEFYGTGSGAEFQAELFDGGPNSGGAERWDHTFFDDTAGWRTIDIPFADFTLATDFNPNVIDSVLGLDTMWGYVFPVVSGNDVVKFDDISLYVDVPDTESILADFEPTEPAGYFSYSGGGGGVGYGVDTVADSDPLARPGQVGDNNILSVGFNVPPGGFGGFGDDFGATSQDWTAFEGFRFEFYGTGSGAEFQAELFDGGPNSGGAERWDHTFFDDTAGWRTIDIPFADFTLATDFNPNVIDSVLGLDTIWGYVFPVVSGNDVVKFDDIRIYASGAITPTASFAAANVNVSEGDIATVEVKLNVASPTAVTVDYATGDGSAVAPGDYTEAIGQLTFDPGETSQTFTVETIEDEDAEPNETIALALTGASGADLGLDAATVTILNDDAGEQPPTFDKRVIVDDFESGLPNGTDGDGLPIGFYTFQDANPGTSVGIQTVPAPEPVPGQTDPNNVMQLDADVVSFAGFTHAFENPAVDEWVTQDWSRFNGVSFWMNGNNSATNVFVDILDNRNPGSTSDDAERFSVTFADDFLGWKYISIPFSDFSRKEIGNGAPNDGLNLTEVHGWAVGTVSTPSAQTFLIDDFALVVREVVIDDFESGLPAGTDPNGVGIGFQTFSDGSPISISTTDTPPAPAPAATPPNSVLQMDSDVGSFAGFAHSFEDESVSNWVSQDWSSFEGISFWLHGAGNGTTLFFDVIDNRNPGSVVDDGERFSVAFTDDTAGWTFVEFGFDAFSRKDIGNGAPNDGFGLDEVWGYAFGSLASGGPQTQYLDDVTIFGNNGSDIPLEVRYERNRFDVSEGEIGTATVRLTRPAEEEVRVDYATSPTGDRQDTEDLIATPDRDYQPTNGTLVFAPGETAKTFEVTTFEDDKWEVSETVVLTLSNPVGVDIADLLPRASLRILDDDPRDPNLIDDFETFPWKFETTGSANLSLSELEDSSPFALPGQTRWENVLEVNGTGTVSRQFEQPVDWSDQDGISVWVNGTGSGEDIGIQLLDNRQPDPGPGAWELAWADEFDAPAGTPADPANWTYETGGWGWGNDEFQYYTDSTNNAAHDGAGNMVITVEEVADPAAESLPCWYGDCTHTSARLISEMKQEFRYGRIESRALVPQGTGIWPAVWTLGNDFRDVRWPQTGEIDVMEFVGRLPEEVFGTIHGPGYSGGQAWFGDINIGEGVFERYHTFTVEWEPNLIRWYIDGVQYHEAVPANVAPNEWVFDHPFFLLLNVAVGGNFGGPIGDDLTFPAELAVDYVRVYQAPDTSERFEATIRDTFTGWKQVQIPFDAFERSADQPAGAPDDGLTLTEVWGYGLQVTEDGPNRFDQVRTEETIEVDEDTAAVLTRVRAELNALAGDPGLSNQARQQLRRARSRVGNALTLLADGQTEAGLMQISDAIEYLMRAERQGAPVGGQIDELVQVGYTEAHGEIRAAVRAGVDPNGAEIVAARREMKLAGEDLNQRDRPDKAVDHYATAWRIANDARLAHAP